MCGKNIAAVLLIAAGALMILCSMPLRYWLIVLGVALIAAGVLLIKFWR